MNRFETRRSRNHATVRATAHKKHNAPLRQRYKRQKFSCSASDMKNIIEEALVERHGF